MWELCLFNKKKKKKFFLLISSKILDRFHWSKYLHL